MFRGIRTGVKSSLLYCVELAFLTKLVFLAVYIAVSHHGQLTMK